MRIKERKIDEIRPYDGNPRINDAAVDAVAASIREFGFRQPIVVDKEGVIVCGHTRYKAALKLGLKTVPVHVAEDLSPEQIKAYRLADNRSAENAAWDYGLLPIELDELRSAGFDLKLIGFDSVEIPAGPGQDLPEGADGTDYDETAADDVAMQECPNCGHRFPK